MVTNMHIISPKNWLAKKYTYMAFKNFILILICYVGTITNPVSAFEFKDVVQAFETDFNRENPIRLRGRFESIIESISGMNIDDQIRISFKPRGDVKYEYFLQDMQQNNMAGEAELEAYEFLLKQFDLLNPDHNLKDILFDSHYDNLYGFYHPKSKNLVMMEGTSKHIIMNILFHELVHAAQDSALDLNALITQRCTTLDASLAFKALVEGQASAIEIFIRIDQNLQNQTRKEVLQNILSQMNSNLNYEIGDELDFLSRLETFPYYFGLEFVLQRYLNDTEDFAKMFDRIPDSSEQVLHIEKFQKDEKPVITVLQKNTKALKSLPGFDLLLETTLGEYYIKEIFSKIPSSDSHLSNVNAASGWGGDRAIVMKIKDKLVLVWDTNWDSLEDANEFYERYVDFAKIRLGTEKFKPQNGFDVVLASNETKVFLQKKGKRITIIEGNASPSSLKSLSKVLNL